MKAITTGLLQFYDPTTGKPVANGYVATYDTVSMSPKESFADINGSVTNPNPVPLDSTGSAYIFGEGTYTWVIKNNAGVNVRTIENIGVLAGGAYEIDGDTKVASIGGGNDGYDSDDLIPIYSKEEPHELIGFGTASEVVMQACVDNGTAAGSYELVSSTYITASTAVPAGTLIYDGPQEGYDPVSTRLYEFRGDGNFSVDPQADTNVDDTGVGDNYIDLFRKAATEEMRIKRTPMYWDACKNLIGLQTIEYPIIVIGSNGKFYTTSGSPTAELMAATDPVLDLTSTVWTYVYDPTQTAQYPPWYRSRNQGVTYQNSGSIIAYPQSCKLLELSGLKYLFTNDGVLTESFYKDLGTFELGAGTSGSPAGSYYVHAAPPSDGWHNVWMIKSTGDLVDVCISPKNISLSTTLSGINAIPAEVSATRTWSFGRRIATVYVASGAFAAFNNAGDGVYTKVSAAVVASSAASNVSLSVPLGAAGYFYAQNTSPAGEDSGGSFAFAEIGFCVSAVGSQHTGSYYASYGQTTGQVRLKPDSLGNIYALQSGGGSWAAYCTAYIDLYED